MKVVILAVLFSLNLQAQDFVLKLSDDAEAYPEYSLGDFSQMLQVTPQDLEYYRCDGVSEYDLFRPSPVQNEKADSRRVVSKTGKTEPVIYRKGSLFKKTGKFTSTDGNPLVIQELEDLKRIEKVKEGAKLLRLLERGNSVVTIRQGHNNFEPTLPEGKPYYGVKMASAISLISGKRFFKDKIPLTGIGSGGFVYWNPNIQNNLPPHIILAHELFHALDAVRGFLDARRVVGQSYESTTATEFRATYLENLMRKAAGVKLRKYYGELTSGPGLLDPQGKPRFIPNPCI